MRLVSPMLALALIFSSCGDEKKEAKPCPPCKPSPSPSPVVTASPAPGGGGFPGGGFPIPLPGGGGGFPIPIPGGGGSNPVPGDSSAKVSALLEEINKAREGKGLSKVEIDPKLSCAAQKHSDDVGQKGSCSHTGSDGSSPWSRAESCGTSANGEIIACGQGSPADAVQAWTLSPGHAAIMYDAGQKFMGGGWHNNYWTAIFRK